MKRHPPIAATMVGALMDWMLQIVEMLVEQCSMPLSEFVERVALADRYDVNVSTFTAALNSRLALACPSSGTATLCTISVTMEPSFFSNLRGALVLMNSGMEGSINIKPADPS